MDEKIFEKEREKFEKWFWEEGKDAMLKIESPSTLMLVAWIARAKETLNDRNFRFLKRNIQMDLRTIIGKEIPPQDRIRLLMEYTNRLDSVNERRIKMDVQGQKNKWKVEVETIIDCSLHHTKIDDRDRDFLSENIAIHIEQNIVAPLLVGIEKKPKLLNEKDEFMELKTKIHDLHTDINKTFCKWFKDYK